MVATPFPKHPRLTCHWPTQGHKRLQVWQTPGLPTHQGFGDRRHSGRASRAPPRAAPAKSVAVGHGTGWESMGARGVTTMGYPMVSILITSHHYWIYWLLPHHQWLLPLLPHWCYQQFLRANNSNSDETEPQLESHWLPRVDNKQNTTYQSCSVISCRGEPVVNSG